MVFLTWSQTMLVKWYLKSQKSLQKLDKRAIKCKNVFLKIDQKLHRYDQISGQRCLWSLRQMEDSWICWGYVYHRFWDFFHFASIAGCACEFHFSTFRGNFKHYDWPHLIPCMNNNKACLIFYMLDKDDDGFFTKASSNWNSFVPRMKSYIWSFHSTD